MKLFSYTLRRLSLAVVVLFGLSVFVFILTRSISDPATAYLNPHMSISEVKQIEAKYHFNAPLYIQYFYWLWGVLHGDLGLAATFGYRPVLALLVEYIPLTAELAIYTVIISVPLALWLGTVSAKNKGRLADQVTRVVSISGLSLPSFVFGLLVLFIFYKNGITVVNPTFNFPEVTGMPTIDALIAGNWVGFVQAWQYLIGPLLVLVYGNIATITRVLRSSMIEELQKDYVIAARAKGLSESAVVIRHARRNALIPFVTVATTSAGFLLTGSAIVETVFNRFGIGLISVNAAEQYDFPLVLGYTLFVGAIIIFVNFIADILYAYLDPRIRLGE